MRCPRCGAYGAPDDNFCRRCGAPARNWRLPVKRNVQPPAVWRRAAPALVQGATLIAVGVAAEWLLRTAARGALGLASRKDRPKRSGARALALRRGPPPDSVLAVSETVVMKRVIVRR